MRCGHSDTRKGSPLIQATCEAGDAHALVVCVALVQVQSEGNEFFEKMMGFAETRWRSYLC